MRMVASRLLANPNMTPNAPVQQWRRRMRQFRSVRPGLCAVPMVLLIVLMWWCPAAAQQKNEISLSRQPGFPYLPSLIIEKQQLIEKHAKQLGLPTLKVNWVNFSGGGAQTDALLAGAVDFVTPGASNMLLLWDRTKGGVKGVVALSAQSLHLITKNASIKSLRDFGPADRIAVPTVGISTQAILLQLACVQQFGPDQAHRLDVNTVQMGHPDAMAALANVRHEVTSHFSAPPFSYLEMKTIPNARVILRTEDVIGGSLTNAQFFGLTRFADANPKVIEALKAATLEAIDFINKDTRAALGTYREISKDKTSVEELLEALKQPGAAGFSATPQGTMKLAEHLYKIGTLKTMPKAWTDYYMPIAHDLKGS